MADIVKISDFKPVSFQPNNKSSFQVKLITDLIKKCLKEERVINVDDVLDTYVLYQKNRKYRKFIIQGFSDGNYRSREVSEEEFRTHWTVITKAKQWFRSNLGSAVISGKLLVIPIIEID